MGRDDYFPCIGHVAIAGTSLVWSLLDDLSNHRDSAVRALPLAGHGSIRELSCALSDEWVTALAADRRIVALTTEDTWTAAGGIDFLSRVPARAP